jgi:rubrerythrin
VENGGNVAQVVSQCVDTQQRYLAVLTLSEAETIRRMIHVGKYGQKRSLFDNTKKQNSTQALISSGLSPVIAVLLQDKASMALRTIQGHVVDATDDFVAESRHYDIPDKSSSHVRSVEAGMQCLRFFNNDMFFSAEQLDLIISALPCDHQTRQVFFEETLRRRRRERKVFTETPVNKLFVPSKHWDLLRPIALIARIRWRFYNELKHTQKLKLELEYLEGKFRKSLVQEADQLTSLMSMGYGESAAKKALEAADGDQNRAAEMLMQGRFKPKSKGIHDPNGQWVCGACTVMNLNVQRQCQMCGTPWELRNPALDIVGSREPVLSEAEVQKKADEEAARALAEQQKQDILDDQDPLRQEICAMQARLQAQIKARPQSAEELYKKVLADGADMVNTTAIERLLRLDEGVSFSSADVAGILKLGDEKDVGYLDLPNFTKLFVPELPPKPEVSSVEDTQWTCPMDGLPIPISVDRCPICGTAAPDSSEAVNGVVQNVRKPKSGQWECNRCHFFNSDRGAYCEICGSAKP